MKAARLTEPARVAVARDAGQATVEFLGIASLLLLIIFFIFQLCLSLSTRHITDYAAYMGARAAAVEGDPAAIVESHVASMRWGTRASVGAGKASADVDFWIPIRFPLVWHFIPDQHLRWIQDPKNPSKVIPALWYRSSSRSVAEPPAIPGGDNEV